MSIPITIAASVVVALAIAATDAAQTAPSTDVYLAPITLSGRAANGIAIVTPVNITHRQGYDNQPAFMVDERAVFYTSTREDGQADIYRYDIATRQTARVTATPESEYSATLMPGTNRFSVVRVERDSTQRLWSFAMDGSDPRLVLRSIKPVGYHAWLDQTHVALFVLGTPATLQLATVGSEHVDTLARNIGRSLSAAGVGRVSFATRAADADSGFLINAVTIDRATGQPGATVQLARMPPGAEYVVWAAPDYALTAAGSKLFALRLAGADAHWAEVGGFAADGIRHITRLAISPNGHWLAMVADDGR
jgi:hypothetical protein